LIVPETTIAISLDYRQKIPPIRGNRSVSEQL
jgi:hypothetical protein